MKFIKFVKNKNKNKHAQVNYLLSSSTPICHHVISWNPFKYGHGDSIYVWTCPNGLPNTVSKPEFLNVWPPFYGSKPTTHHISLQILLIWNELISRMHNPELH